MTRNLNWKPDNGIHRPYARTMGAYLVFLPISSPHLIEEKPNHFIPSADLRAWVDYHIGPAGSYIRSLFETKPCPVCYHRETQRTITKLGNVEHIQTGYNFYFNQRNNAVLFKMTWC